VKIADDIPGHIVVPVDDLVEGLELDNVQDRGGDLFLDDGHPGVDFTSVGSTKQPPSALPPEKRVPNCDGIR
jgi:hypothetical protein